MPELPEVQTVTDFIRPYLINHKILSIQHLNNFTAVFATHTQSSLNRIVSLQLIKRVWRRGKFIVIDLNAGHLLIHLRMTGRILPKILKKDNPNHFTAQINLTNDTKIFFKDYRKFGRFYYYQSMDPIEAKLGLEPLSNSFSSKFLINLLKSKKRMIKPLLMDQACIAGLGNIYVDETLWLAKINPEQLCFKIGIKKITNLHSSIQSVLKSAIKNHGTTIINFTYGEKSTGNYKEKLNVFGRTEQPCMRCQRKIKKIYVSQRGTHFCPRCQR